MAARGWPDPELLQIVPDCRIVVLTGYASIATGQTVGLKRHPVSAKPVGVDAILAAFDGRCRDPEFRRSASDEPCRSTVWNGAHPACVLNENDGNISATARALKMHRRTHCSANSPSAR